MTLKPIFVSVICCLLLLFSNTYIHAQNFKFKHFSSDEGLSQVSVQSILQDSNGFMWFATQDGLNRFDGFHFKVFKNNPLDKTTISSNVIYSLYEDTDGLIYIGTQETGLSVFNRYTETFTNYQPSAKKGSLSSPSVRSISASNNSNELLIGTEDGLCVFNKTTKQFETIKPTNSDKPFYIMKVFKTSNGKLLIAAPRFGIYEFKSITKTLVPFYVPEDFNNPKLEAYTMALINIEEKNNSLWVSSFKGGVYQIDCGSGKLINKIDFKSIDEELNSIKEIKSLPNSPYLFIATSGGLIQYNTITKDFIVIQHNINDGKSLINNDLLAIFIDKQSTIWLGTYSNGVDMSLNAVEKFKHIKIEDIQENNSVSCFLETKDKTIYVGTDNGLYIFDKKNSNHPIRKINWISSYCLFENYNHNIIIGTLNKGLFEYDKTKNSLTPIIPELEGASIYNIKKGINDVIYVATFGRGLWIINPYTKETKNYTVEDGLLSNKILSLFFDEKKNNLWTLTSSGISVLDFILDSKKPFITNFKRSDNDHSISSNVIFDMVKGENDLYWIATNNGLNCFDANTKKTRTFTEGDGLANNTIWSISKDNENNLWLATTNGLSKFNPNVKNINGSAFRNYDMSDGLQGKEFNQGASLVCSDGSILVGGLIGFNYFNPKDIIENKVVPQPYIYSFSRQGKEIKLDSAITLKKGITLPYSENYFSFELIAQNYSSPEKTKFIYKLEGKDNDWSSPSTTRFVSYTGLEGGSYTFLFKTCNSDGIWNATPSQLTITIIPPWYKTTWFYILASISFIGGVIGFIRLRTAAIKKENKELENKVTERTKELAEKNHDITSSIEYAKRIQDAILPAQDVIFSKLKQCFILYKPKDIVSGDFYWFFEKDHYQMIAAVDCTGHGVPGAFMSMIGHNLLNQIVSDKNITDPGLILQELHKGVQSALKQGQSKVNTNDGMDVSFLVINTKTNEYKWAGAYRNLIVVKHNLELEKIEGNKYPIGGAQLESQRVFETHSRFFEPNTMLYLFSDGYADQFGGESGKKFMVKRFHQLLLEVSAEDIVFQKTEIEKNFNSWKKENEQVDDVLVIGIRTT